MPVTALTMRAASVATHEITRPLTPKACRPLVEPSLPSFRRHAQRDGGHGDATSEG